MTSQTPPSRPRASARAVRRRAILVVAIGEWPEPAHGVRGRGFVEVDAADELAIGQHVVIVRAEIPGAGRRPRA